MSGAPPADDAARRTRDNLMLWLLDLRDTSRRRADAVRWRKLTNTLMVNWISERLRAENRLEEIEPLRRLAIERWGGLLEDPEKP